MVNQYYNIIIQDTTNIIQNIWDKITLEEILIGVILAIIVSIIEGLLGYTKFIVKYFRNRKIRKEILSSINLQVDNQLKKQKYSSKYIPDTYIEIDNVKDKLRYFSNPIFFFKKVRDELGILDFMFLNVFLKSKNYERFDLNFRFDALKSLRITIKNFSILIYRVHNFLNNKKNQLESYEGTNTNNFYLKINLFHDKIERKIEEVKYLKARIIIIKESAGQGKTNLICDLYDNFLKKLGIPSVFFIGNDLKSDDINASFIRHIFGIKDKFKFDELMKHIGKISKKIKKYFIITIDGINENLDYNKFPSELEKFIESLFKYNFIKIILTCRTEYFQANYCNLEKSSFKDNIVFIERINKGLNDNSKEKLFNSYLSHFHIELPHYNKKVFDVLTSDFLLLRIFAEAYANQNVKDLRDIYKEEIFRQYYDKKCRQINERLRNNDELKITGGFNIRYFFNRLIEYMLENKKYYNLPIREFISNNNEEVLIRCIDEEVLLRRDLHDNSTTSNEVITFTFDEFRDFLIADYLINEIYKIDENKFQDIIKKDLVETSHILEGVSKYLFYISKRKKDSKIREMIKNCSWYSNIFFDCIFSMDDGFIDEDDLNLIKEKFKEGIKYSSIIIMRLMHRYDEDYYKKLNLNFLINFFVELNDDDFNKFVFPIFDVDAYDEEHRYYRYDYQIWPIERLVNNLEDILDNNRLSEDPKLHNVFEFMIFLLPTSTSVGYLLMNYAPKYPKLIKTYLQRRLNVRSSTVKDYIQESLNNLNHVLPV